MNIYITTTGNVERIGDRRCKNQFVSNFDSFRNQTDEGRIPFMSDIERENSIYGYIVSLNDLYKICKSRRYILLLLFRKVDGSDFCVEGTYKILFNIELLLRFHRK